MIIIATLSVIIGGYNLGATGGNVVISQVQTKSLSGGSASEELIEIYNNSDRDIDITNWCLKYGSAVESSNAPKLEPVPSRTIKCFTADMGQTLFLPARSYIVLVSSVFKTNYPTFGFDYEFGATLADINRWLAIYDSNDLIIDLVEWGNFTQSDTAEGGQPSQVPIFGNLLSRLEIEPGYLQDTNNNLNDFASSLSRPVYFYGFIYDATDMCLNLPGFQSEADIPEGYLRNGGGNCFLDMCLNLDGLQKIIPDGYHRDANGHCFVDMCLNIEGLQDVVPIGLERDAGGNCWFDECPNLPGIQKSIPPGYKLNQAEQCVLETFPLYLTELLPNPIGSDYGNEYIEIFNPTTSIVSLKNYLLSVGAEPSKDYPFPDGAYIEPGSYLAIFNNVTKFTLVNTTSQVSLKTIENEIIDQSPIYNNPKEGFAWALIDEVWQYTNQPTPGLANLPSLIDDIDDSGLAPCAPNQYRNPLTNRCKLLPEYESQLVPCKEGQYRSEITNRCRNIVSDIIEYIPCPEGQERNPLTNRCRKIPVPTVLAPCPEGQERNPETNRCRKIPVASVLKPCPEGQERNPETNRCRKIVQMTKAGYAPKKEKQSTDDLALIIILSLLGVGALLYGIWEWRYEIKAIAFKAMKLVGRA